jgi:3-hydroxyisobutyrate dehydrogenase-like beta-hydroxyacid dehydrogenase
MSEGAGLRVGFIGLGTMGASMATNLQRAGHALTVHDTRQEAAAAHLAAGAQWADSPRAVAAACPLVFLSLPGPAEVEAVALGENGLLPGLPAGGACFDLSTNAPGTVRRVEAAFAAAGRHFLDAPVSGGPAGAASGRLALWVGGDEETFNRHRPVLEAIGDQVRWIGAIGAGTVAKLVHNCAGYILTVGLAEVFTLGVKAGVEPLALFEAVRQGALGRRRTFDGLADQFLPGRYDPPAFALKLAHKDVSLATALGCECGVPMRLANLTLEEMTEALARGWGSLDSRSCMKLQEERAGVAMQVEVERLKQAISGSS